MSISTKGEFDEIIEKIKSLVIQYENNSLHFNQYQIYLANGDKLSFEVSPKVVPHLLGIRLDYLIGTNLFKSQDAYSLMKDFLENSYSVYRYVQEGRLFYTSLFSRFLEEKLETFEKIIYYFDPSDIEFICKYDKSKTFQLGLETNSPCDYFIAKKMNNGDIYLLGLVRQGNIYMPMSSMTFRNDENQITGLKSLLLNQVLTFSSNILINNEVTHFNHSGRLNVSNKLNKINTLKKYASQIKGVSVDVSNDYQFVTTGYTMKDNKINDYKMVCQQLKEAILERKLFTLDEKDADAELVSLVNAYNDGACTNGNEQALKSYSTLALEYDSLVKKVCNLELQLEKEEEQSAAYYKRVQALEEENLQYKEFQESVYSLVRNQQQKQLKN